MDRRFRAWVRSIGPIGGEIDTAAWARTITEQWIEKQKAYHEGRAARLQGAERMLHFFAYAGFVLAFLGCAGHLVPYVAPNTWLGRWTEHHSVWLTVIAAGMPAWGAACHAISVQGEFLRLIERSEEMVHNLEKAKKEIDELSPSFPLDRLRDLTIRLAQLMLDEVTDWRIVHHGPEFILP
jgi:hypothetical protein